MSGHESGELVIWHNYEIKKSLHLFKTCITGLSILLKPKEMKIYQGEKIKSLHKYEQSKEEEPLVVVPRKHEDESIMRGEEEEADEDEVILQRMLSSLRQP